MSKVLFSKEKIMSLISDLNLSLDVVNINKFDKEVTIDLLIENFTHKSKSEAKNSIIKQLSSSFDSKLIYLLNFKPKVTNINDENPFGINVDDPFGRDDILVQSDYINLENNKPVKILLRSVDVLHNWYVPQFRSKMDAVPGIVTFYWFEPNKVGEYEVLCAEYCGVGHYAMRGGVEVQSTEDYTKWLSEQETFQDLIAKQEKLEFENKKIVKNNNFILNKDIYKKE